MPKKPTLPCQNQSTKGPILPRTTCMQVLLLDYVVGAAELTIAARSGRVALAAAAQSGPPASHSCNAGKLIALG
jgi:hypothetical protein